MPKPQTKVGRLIADALAGRSDESEVQAWSDGQDFEDLFIRGQAIVGWVCIAQAATHRFGNPMDVRALTRWLQKVRDEVPACRQLRVREAEFLIRGMVNEPYLVSMADWEAINSMGHELLMALLVLVREYVADTGVDVDQFVAEAEAQLAAGGFVTQMVERFKTLGTTMRDDPSHPDANHPAIKATRRAYLGDDS